MIMIETDILQALQTAALAAYDASDLAALSTWGLSTTDAGKARIKAVGRTLITPSDACWLEFVHITNNRSGDYIGDERVYQGNFRFILHWKVDDQGAYTPSSYIDQIASFFPKGKAFRSGQATVNIYDVPMASGVIEDGSELLFPLSLPYRCFKA